MNTIQKKSIMFASLILLVCTIMILSLQGDLLLTDELTLEIPYMEDKETIVAWSNGSDGLIFFLPSSSDLQTARIILNTQHKVFLNGKLLESGMLLEGFELNIPYTLMRTTIAGKKETTCRFLQSANLAAMYIDTQSGNMNYIHTKKGNEEKGSVRLYWSDGTLDCSEIIKSINGRGNDTWFSYEKKAYSMTLERETDLLEMGSAEKWILLANASDASHLRNKSASALADVLSLPFTSESRWVDLYLNGEYAGLYLLSERNEIHPERIDVAKEEGFLVSLELESRLQLRNRPYILTETGQALRVHYPVFSESIRDSLESQWNVLERSIMSEEGVDPITGKTYSDIIDLESWAKKYLLEEVLGNLDAVAISQYFYQDGTGKIYAGPIWDYDLSMGNQVVWQLNYPNAIFANRTQVKADVTAPWFAALYKKEEFRTKVLDIYQNAFKPHVVDFLENEFQMYESEILQAAYMDQIRWSREKSIEEEAEHIYEYLMERIAFLDSYWLVPEEYSIVRIDDGNNSNYAYLAVKQDTRLTELPSLNNRDNLMFIGWYYADTDEPFDIATLITTDVEICAKWESVPAQIIGKIAKLIPLGMITIVGTELFIREQRLRKKSR